MFHLLFFTTVIAPSVALPNDGCMGGHKHGDTVDMATYWYVCKNGSLVSTGCFALDRHRMNIGDEYEADGVVAQCDANPNNGEAHISYPGCRAPNGAMHKANEFWNEDKMWFYCEQLGNGLRLNYGGCVMNDDRIPKDTQVVRQGVIYNCFSPLPENNVEAGLRPVGCMFYAKRYNLGDTFEDDTTWYTCDGNVTTAVRAPRGCIYKQKRLNLGQKYMKEKVIYQCTISADKSSADHTPYACVTNRGLKTIGLDWLVGDSPHTYRVTCESDGETAFPRVQQCVYTPKHASAAAISVGCYRVVGDEAIACKEKDGNLVYTVFDAQHAKFAWEDFGVIDCGGESDNELERMIRAMA